jgi:hypothetical protein
MRAGSTGWVTKNPAVFGGKLSKNGGMVAVE